MRILAAIGALEYESFHRRPHYEGIHERIPGFEFLSLVQIGDPRRRRFSGAPIRINRVWKLFPSAVKSRFRFCRSADGAFVGAQVRRLLRRFDVLHVSSPHDVEIVRHASRLPVVYELYDPHVLMGIPAVVETELVSRSTAVLATARALISDYLPRFAPPDRLQTFYWPNAADTGHWTARSRNDQRRKTIGYLGHINSLTFDPRLFERLVREFPEARFELAGRLNFRSGEEAAEKAVRELLEMKGVLYHGFVPYDRLPSIVGRWDVGLVLDPSSEAGAFIHHNKVYEYLAAGLPVVATGVQPDYQRLGFPVQVAGEGERFVAALRAALQDSRRGETIDAAVALARIHSTSVRAGQYLEIVRGLTEKVSAGGRFGGSQEP